MGLIGNILGNIRGVASEGKDAAQDLKKGLPHIKATRNATAAWNDELVEVRKSLKDLKEGQSQQTTGLLAGAAALGMWARGADTASKAGAGLSDVASKASGVFGKLPDVLTDVRETVSDLANVSAVDMKKWGTQVLATSQGLSVLAGGSDKAREAAMELISVANKSILTDKMSDKERKKATEQYVQMRRVMEGLGVDSEKTKKILQDQLATNGGDLNKALGSLKEYTDQHLGLRNIVSGPELKDASRYIAEQGEQSALAATNAGSFASSMHEMFAAAKQAGASQADILETVKQTRNAMTSMLEQDWKSADLGTKIFGNMKQRYELAQKLGKSAMERKQLEESLAQAAKGDFKTAKAMIDKFQDVPEIRNKLLKEFTTGLGASKSGMLIEAVFGGKEEEFKRAQAMAKAMQKGVTTGTVDAFTEANKIAEDRKILDPLGYMKDTVVGYLKEGLLEGTTDASKMLGNSISGVADTIMSDPTMIAIAGLATVKGASKVGKGIFGWLKKKTERGSTPMSPMYVKDTTSMLGGRSGHSNILDAGSYGAMDGQGGIGKRAGRKISGAASKVRGAVNSKMAKMGMGIGAVAGLLEGMPDIYADAMEEMNAKGATEGTKLIAGMKGSARGVLAALNGAMGGIPSQISQALGGVSFDEIPAKFGEAIDEVKRTLADPKGIKRLASQFWSDITGQGAIADQQEKKLYMLREKIAETSDAGVKKALQEMEEKIEDSIVRLRGNSPGGLIPEGFDEAYQKAEDAAKVHLQNISVMNSAVMPGAGALSAGGTKLAPGTTAAGSTDIAGAVTAAGGLVGQVTGMDGDGNLTFAIPNFAQAFAQYQKMQRRVSPRR